MGESTRTKVCNKCGAEKPLDEYHKSRDNRDGRKGACKKCSTAIAVANARKRRSERPEVTDVPPEKTCSRCGETRPSGQFYRSKLALDGLTSWCRACNVAAAKESAERRRGRPKAPPPSGAKPCTRCSETKPIADFYPSPTARDGLTAACAECLRADSTNWRRSNPEAAREARRAYDEAHRPAKIANLKLWREANTERRREYAQQYGIANADRMAKAKRAWYEANSDRLREMRRNDPEVIAKRRAANERHRSRNRDRITERQRKRRVDKLGLVVTQVDLDALWTGTCGICEQPLDTALRWPDPYSKSVDHITPLARGGTHEAHNLQWAHLRCNLIKGAKMPDVDTG